MEKRIGISIYPDKTSLEETIEYIGLAHKYGVKRIFSNLLEINKTEKGIQRLESLKKTLIHARDLGMEVIVDVAPSVYKDLELEPSEFNFFKELGATAIRLDEDFKGEVESKLSQNIIVELNASSGTKTMRKTLEKGGKPSNLIACHNFYPMEFTGMGTKRFLELTKEYKTMGTKTAAFITLPRGQKNTVGPWDVNDGIPTLELHRNATLEEQVRHFLAMDIVDDIIFSEQGATEEQFKIVNKLMFDSKYKFNERVYSKFNVNMNTMQDFLKQEVGLNPSLIFKLEDEQIMSEVERTILFDFPHHNRPDVTEYFIRSTFSRIIFKNDIIEPRKFNKEFFEVGDIVILNKEYNRYMGELHIITKRIPYSGKRNYVGRISNFDHELLEFAKPGREFKII